MTKRTKLALILLIGLVLIGIGVYIFIQPYLAQRQAAQPPVLPTSVTPSTPSAPGTAPSTGGAGQAPTTVSTSQTRQLLGLEQRASATVERIGSGASIDGFLGYQDALAGFTASGQAAMRVQQKAMQTAHPATGPLYGISTRVVSSHIVGGTIGDQTLTATIEAIQRTDAGDPSKPTSTKGKRVTVTYAVQADGSYLIDTMAWEDMAL